jgi:hypothetical protein
MRDAVGREKERQGRLLEIGVQQWLELLQMLLGQERLELVQGLPVEVEVKAVPEFNCTLSRNNEIKRRYHLRNTVLSVVETTLVI